MRQEQEIKKLKKEIENLKCDLWWLVGGGEFAEWIRIAQPSMPAAAAREYEEAKRYFPTLKEKQS